MEYSWENTLMVSWVITVINDYYYRKSSLLFWNAKQLPASVAISFNQK